MDDLVCPGRINGEVFQCLVYDKKFLLLRRDPDQIGDEIFGKAGSRRIMGIEDECSLCIAPTILEPFTINHETLFRIERERTEFDPLLLQDILVGVLDRRGQHYASRM